VNPSQPPCRHLSHPTPRNTTEIFSRLLPFAPKFRFRFVFINRRDYPGSTPLSQAEIASADEQSDDASRTAFWRRRAVEIAHFSAWFIRENAIPPLVERDGKKEGGLTLYGWSFGTTVFMDILATPEEIPTATRDTLEPYLRSLVGTGENSYLKLS
jgi:hypothetical protein